MDFNRNKIGLLLVALTSIVLCYFLFGFYFERYEPLAVALISGVFTPGMLYDDFFYLAHIWIVKLFAHLFRLVPAIPWLSVFQYSYLFISFLILGRLIQKQTKAKLIMILALFVFSFFFMEYYVLHVMTRVSYVLSFSALLQLIHNFETKRKNRMYNAFLLLLFFLAVLIRPEPPSIITLIVGLFYFIVNSNGRFFIRLKNSLQVFLFPSAICLGAIFWVGFQIQNSDEFYKQIEPEVEYELMSRNNFVSWSNMGNRIDSLRYEAIYLGIWGDATTNDANFLRSLIGKDESSLNYLAKNAFSAIEMSANNCRPIIYLNFILFTLSVLFLFLNKKKFKALQLIVFHPLFLLVVLLMSYKVKMVETSLSPMMFSVTILYSLISLQESNSHKLRFLLFTTLPIVILQLLFLHQVSDVKHREYEEAKLVIQSFEKNYSGDNIFIDRIAFELIFKGFKPFQTIEFAEIDKIYLFDSQHMSTVQPYKDYLAQDCDCDPNNYKEYFSYVLKHKEKSVFFIDQNNATFYEEYLKVVHGLNSKWRKETIKEELGNNAKILDQLDFFRIDYVNSGY